MAEAWGKLWGQAWLQGGAWEKTKGRWWGWWDVGPAALNTAEPEAMVPQRLKQTPGRAAGVPPAQSPSWHGPACVLPCTSAPLSACLELMKEQDCLETDGCISVLPCWAGLQAVQAPGWACGGAALGRWCLCHSSRQLVLTLQQEGNNREQVLTVPQSFDFFCSRMWLWDHRQPVCLLLLSDALLKGQHTGSLASHQMLRLRSGLTLVLSSMLYGVIPAQSKPQDWVAVICLA